MIRPATFVAMLTFVFAGLFLYQTKHRSQVLDREIAQVQRATEEARAHTMLLRADYQMLGAPGRLQDLSQQLLKLRPTSPTQYATLADLAQRLPPVGPMPSDLAPAAEPASQVSPVPPTPPPLAAKPEPKPEAKPDSQSIKPPATPIAANAPKSVPRAPTATAVNLAATRPSPAPAPAHAPKSAIAAPPTAHPVATPVSFPTTTVSLPAIPVSSAEAIRQIVRGGGVDPSVPAVASALGMARSIGGAPNITAQAATLRRATTEP